jgi:hypothetical protein
MPPVFKTSLRFTFQRASAASTSLGTIAFSGNNVQDPGLSAGAEQPPGFTQLATLYSRYRVIGSHVELRAIMTTTATGGGFIANGDICIYPSNSSGAPADFEAACSQPYAQWREITGATPQVMKKTMNTAMQVGQRSLVGADRLQALVSGAPSEEWYWLVVFQSDAAYTNINLEWHLQITYDVEFFDRPTVNQALESWKHIKLAYIARCRELEAEQQQEAKRKEERKDAILRDHTLTETKLHKESSVEEFVKAIQESKDEKDQSRDRWLKLRELDRVIQPPLPTPSRAKVNSLK